MTKIALICFHSNLKQYPKEWIDQFRDSILNQTYKDFDIFECSYNITGDYIFAGSYHIQGQLLKNHAEAMNKLIDSCFELGYDFVFNTNIDDTYALDRIEKQLPYLLDGYDIVSSNFDLFDDKVFHTHQFHGLNLRQELLRGHNLICHPVVAYSKHFWTFNRYYPHEIPLEDMKLWQRSVRSFMFVILPDVLCHHREHAGGVGRS